MRPFCFFFVSSSVAHASIRCWWESCGLFLSLWSICIHLYYLFFPYGKPLLCFRSAPGWAVVSSSCGIREWSPALVGGTFLTGVGLRSYEYTGYVICSRWVVIVGIVVEGGRGRETSSTSRNLHTLSPCYCRFMLFCTRRSRFLQWNSRSD